MQAKKLPFGALVGLITSLIMLVVMNLMLLASGVAVAQDDPTPTPLATVPPTATSTPLPGLQLQAFVTLNPDGDLNADGVINIQDLSIAAGNYMLTSPQVW